MVVATAAGKNELTASINFSNGDCCTIAKCNGTSEWHVENVVLTHAHVPLQHFYACTFAGSVAVKRVYSTDQVEP